MIDRLVYRRQFLMSREPVRGLDGWDTHRIGQFCLHVHPDLQVTEVHDSRRAMILLGYLFDPGNCQSTNDEVLQRLLDTTKDFDSFIFALKPYAGRYVLIYRDGTNFVIMNDPLGLREIYYCTQPNAVICGSQPNLIDAFSNPKLGVTKDEGILHFYQNDLKLVRSGRLWVGDETYYQDVRHLMPNHYLEVRSLAAKRYWPNRRLEKMDAGTAVKQSCEYLKGVLKAAASRHNLMIAVTSGFDSRSLLAASRDVKGCIYYFINKTPPLNETSPDIRIPLNMFSKLNIQFHVHDFHPEVDEKFRQVFLNNVFMSTDWILSTIYNVYYRNHQDKINLLAVGELGRDYYGNPPRDLDGYYLARCLKYRSSRYATARCEEWLRNTRAIAETYNVDIMRLFLWEGLLATWGVVGNSESDIAIEEFDPYDSHYIYEIMLSIDPAKVDLFRGMLNKMWPELLDFPFNPPGTLIDRIKQGLERAGIYKRLKRQIYRFDRWKFSRKVSRVWQ